MAKAGPINRESAENLAISALAFLAGDPERLGRFLSLTGIGPDAIRKAATEPAFLAGVLDHVVSDEALLVAVAAHAGVSPFTVERAQAVLSGKPWEREVP
jgi:Protein of unknown function (DUF3572)